MEVALVHDYLTRLGGAERVLAVLAKMYPKAPIYTFLYDEKKVGYIFPKERVVTSRLQKLPGIIRNRPRYLLPLLPRIVEEWDFSPFDLAISSSSAFTHGILTPPKTHHLCYMHSPMRFAWDWTHEYLREQRVGPLKKMAIAHLLKKIRMWDQNVADRADTVVANSKNVWRRIQKYYHRDAPIIYPPVSLSRFKISKTHEDYFLIISTLTPYKRIDLAVQLFNKIRKRLIIIGDGPQKNFLESIAGSTIEFRGYVDDSAASEYMHNCRALIFPGEEDFGITPVEALACGKPVLAYGQGGVTETVEAGVSGEFFAEPTVASMEDSLARLINNYSHYKPTVMRKRAEEFSEEIFTDRMRKLTCKLTAK